MKIKKSQSPFKGSILLEAVTALLVFSITSIALLMHINMRLQAISLVRERLKAISRLKGYIARKSYIPESASGDIIFREHFSAIEMGTFIAPECTKITLKTNTINNSITLITGTVSGEI